MEPDPACGHSDTDGSTIVPSGSNTTNVESLEAASAQHMPEDELVPGSDPIVAQPLQPQPSLRLLQRAVGRMSVNGVRHGTLTLTTTALGGGVLAVSYVLFLSGLVLGTLLIGIGAGVAYLSITKLMEMSTVTSHDTYAGLFAAVAGPRAGPFLDFMLFVYGNGACVGFFVFLGDFVPSIALLGGGGCPAFLKSRTFAIVVSACLTAPMAIQRDVSVLRYVAPASIFTLVYVAIIIAAYCESEYLSHLGDDTYGPVHMMKFNLHLFDAFSICIFAYNCHLNVVPVATTFLRPTKARIQKVSWRVNCVQFCFYTLIAVTGYLSWLAATPQNILAIYPKNNVFIVIARVLMTCMMLVTVPMTTVPAVRSGLQLTNYFFPGTGLQLPSPDASPPCSPPRSPGPRPATAPSHAFSSPWPRICFTLASLVVQAFIAINVPGVADVISLLGACIATPIMMAIPAYLMGSVLPPSRKLRAQQFLLYFLSVVSFLSVPIKILRTVQVLK